MLFFVALVVRLLLYTFEWCCFLNVGNNEGLPKFGLLNLTLLKSTCSKSILLLLPLHKRAVVDFRIRVISLHFFVFASSEVVVLLCKNLRALDGLLHLSLSFVSLLVELNGPTSSRKEHQHLWKLYVFVGFLQHSLKHFLHAFCFEPVCLSASPGDFIAKRVPVLGHLHLFDESERLKECSRHWRNRPHDFLQLRNDLFRKLDGIRLGSFVDRVNEFDQLHFILSVDLLVGRCAVDRPLEIVHELPEAYVLLGLTLMLGSRVPVLLDLVQHSIQQNCTLDKRFEHSWPKQGLPDIDVIEQVMNIGLTIHQHIGVDVKLSKQLLEEFDLLRRKQTAILHKLRFLFVGLAMGDLLVSLLPAADIERLLTEITQQLLQSHCVFVGCWMLVKLACDRFGIDVEDGNDLFVGGEVLQQLHFVDVTPARSVDFLVDLRDKLLPVVALGCRLGLRLWLGLRRLPSLFVFSELFELAQKLHFHSLLVLRPRRLLTVVVPRVVSYCRLYRLALEGGLRNGLNDFMLFLFEVVPDVVSVLLRRPEVVDRSLLRVGIRRRFESHGLHHVLVLSTITILLTEVLRSELVVALSGCGQHRLYVFEVGFFEGRVVMLCDLGASRLPMNEILVSVLNH